MCYLHIVRDTAGNAKLNMLFTENAEHAGKKVYFADASLASTMNVRSVTNTGL